MNSYAPPPVVDVDASPFSATSTTDRMRTARVFLAALAPMLTVASIRGLVIDSHRCGPAALHAFVALGMLGAAIGAPLLAARADRTGTHARLAVALPVVDALVTLASAHTTSTALLFALRPIHGIASMGLLALLFGDLRRTSQRFVARAGTSMIAALAIGPALGGVLTKFGATAAFDVAATVSVLMAALLARRPMESVVAPRAETSTTRRSVFDAAARLHAPLALLAIQRAAIGGFIAVFAVRARAAGVPDSRIGASFSLFLVAFAVAVALVGRGGERRLRTELIPLGGVLFTAGFLFLAAFTGARALPFLILAGAGAGMVYAPCLGVAAHGAGSRGHATTMAMVHAAGAVGMVIGPLAAALVDIAFCGMSPSGRGAVFLVVAGGFQALACLALHNDCRDLTVDRKSP
ncbi:MAG: hypothetical protein JST00_08845 [Deltaproteobacteria bacterium]|nr:hypothetical protein [Deltaproteobacteria bacterium]